MQRDHKNYGGGVFATDDGTGNDVERFAAPVMFLLNETKVNGKPQIYFRFAFERWRDVSDFNNGQSPIAAYQRQFSSENLAQDEIAEKFGIVIDAVKAGVLEFLQLGEDFEFASITIDALRFTVSAEAGHKTRPNYRVSDVVSDIESFDKIKQQYLKTIVVPLLGMAWAQAQTDPSLLKFKVLK